MQFIGQKIKKTRLAKRYSLSKISSELKISLSILKDIENDNFNSNQINVFLLGHIRSYSNFLGLNSQDIIDEFKIQHPIKTVNLQDNIPKPINENNFKINKMLSLTSILVILFLFYFLFIDDQKRNTEFALVPDIPENLEAIIEKTYVDLEIEEITKNEALPLSEAPIEEISSSSVFASSKINESIINNKEIILKFTNPTWIQIRNSSDKIIFSQLMTKSDEYSYDLNLGYSVTSGNAGNVLVLIDNEVRGKLGNFGQVVDSIIIDSNFTN